MIALLGPYRWIAYLGLSLSLVLGAFALRTHIENGGVAIGKAQVQALWDADKLQRAAADLKAQQAAQAQRDAAAAQAQATSAAWEQAQAQWAKTLKVTKHDLFVSTENLASCHVSVDSVKLLNSAAAGADTSGH